MPTSNSWSFQIGGKYGPHIYDEESHLELCGVEGCSNLSRAEVVELIAFLVGWLAGEEVSDEDENG
jgi:hypothetical protein